MLVDLKTNLEIDVDESYLGSMYVKVCILQKSSKCLNI